MLSYSLKFIMDKYKIIHWNDKAFKERKTNKIIVKYLHQYCYMTIQKSPKDVTYL